MLNALCSFYPPPCTDFVALQTNITFVILSLLTYFITNNFFFPHPEYF